MTKDEALQMCLEYIETDAHERKYVRHAIKAALEAKDEPVATLLLQSKQNFERNFGSNRYADWIYADLVELVNTTPPQRKPLMDEPVAWVDERAIAWLAEHPNGNVTTKLELQKSFERPMPLYTNPTQRKPLTDEEMEAAIPFGNLSGEYSYDDILNIILLIQAKLRRKNYDRLDT
jgi:hypothetical protein